MHSFSETAFNRELALQLLECRPGFAAVSVEPRPWFLQENDVVHGGIISSVADTAAVYAVRGDPEAENSFTGIELKINFLRPARAAAGPIVARAKVLRHGRTIAVCDVEVEQNEALIAKGLFTYLYVS